MFGFQKVGNLYFTCFSSVVSSQNKEFYRNHVCTEVTICPRSAHVQKCPAGEKFITHKSQVTQLTALLQTQSFVERRLTLRKENDPELWRSETINRTEQRRPLSCPPDSLCLCLVRGALFLWQQQMRRPPFAWRSPDTNIFYGFIQERFRPCQ